MKRRATRRPAHPVAIRIMHWVGVYAMGCMIFSGWEIYNASPSLPFFARIFARSALTPAVARQ
jgi:thiosulfate reductase cytochrome b subunit